MARKKMPDLGAGAEVRRLRLVAGLTQADVATACGVGPAYVAQIEVGSRTGWNPDLLYKLSRILGVECDHWRPYFDPVPGDPPPAPPVPPSPRGRPKKPDTAPAEVPPEPPGKPKRGKKEPANPAKGPPLAG